MIAKKKQQQQQNYAEQMYIKTHTTFRKKNLKQKKYVGLDA